MKKIFHHPPEPLNGKKYWLSLDQVAGTPEFQDRLKREFPAGADEFESGGVSRRSFIKLMGASTALAGLSLSACRRPEKHLVPFTKSAEWEIPGKPLFYATSMPHRRGAQPLVVTTNDGRPTKIEGNPLHPSSGGATGTFAQSSILDLYDPDRSRFFRNRGQESDAAAFDAYLVKLAADLGDSQGKGLAFLCEENNSPTRERLRQEIAKKYPQALWAVYEPLGIDATVDAHKTAFGSGVKVSSNLENADVILALDTDFLGCEEGSVQDIKAYSARRRVKGPEDKMNRLYVVENRYTVTGGMADHRLRLPASQIGAFVILLAEKIGVDAALGGQVKTLADSARAAVKFDQHWLEEMANDLVTAKGRSLVLVGARQPAFIQLLGNAINAALGNLDKTLVGSASDEKPSLSISKLVPLIQNKEITTLFILGGNPVYNAPADLEWENLQKSIPSVVRLGLHEDETSNRVLWHVPGTHYLETWSDGFASDGSYVSVQPMILPLFDGWSEIDILARLLGLPKPQGPELVQDTFRLMAGDANFKDAWNKFLHDGFLKDSSLKPAALTFNAAAAAPFLEQNASVQALGDAIEIVLAGDSKMDDGRYANNGWLQELPDPIMKLTWDNAALMSAATAATFGVKPGAAIGERDFHTIEIALDDKRKIEIPVLIAPGHAEQSITIPLGYGRGFNGRVASGVGVNVYPFRTTGQPYFQVVSKEKLKATGKFYRLAITQDHHSMEGRAFVREATLDTFKETPNFAQTMWMDEEVKRDAKGKPETTTIYTHPVLDDLNQWGMAVDLNTCTGCNACMIACQAENNIPIVGKEQVSNGRSMHWIRNDRYYASVDENDPDPEMVMQPIMCQMCENAPCETVCPVNATVHSKDGLNVMAYNRCIGTRYCANNCPFKVRRFNFFDYQQRPITPVKVPVLGEVSGLKLGPLTEKASPDTLKMQKNPNVTVRMRGVMEKCTFCVQRIQEAKIAQKVKAGASDNVRIPADVFQVACQQACPAEAIVFGDIKNPDSKVSKLKAQEKNYRLLEYLNINTRVSYLARLRNPNPAMPDAAKSAAFEKDLIHKEHEKPVEAKSTGGEA
ncbi:MAG: TAT-variant-translocated molybdopterin oxidoreductase [Chthoniobacteraceae bacterium]